MHINIKEINKIYGFNIEWMLVAGDGYSYS